MGDKVLGVLVGLGSHGNQVCGVNYAYVGDVLH